MCPPPPPPSGRPSPSPTRPRPPSSSSRPAKPRSPGRDLKLRHKLADARPVTLPLPPEINAAGAVEPPCVRTLTLGPPDKTIATLTYHLSEADQAVQQILQVEVEAGHRRRGHASRLIAAAIADAQAVLRRRDPAARLRRVFAATAHKRHIPLRAVLTGLGFHHAATVTGLYRGEDLLIYIKSYT